MGLPLGLSGSLGLFASFAQTVISGRRCRPFSFIPQGSEAVCLTPPFSHPACPREGGPLRACQCQSPGRSSSAARQLSFCPGRGGVAYVALTGSRAKGVTCQLPVGARSWTCGHWHVPTEALLFSLAGLDTETVIFLRSWLLLLLNPPPALPVAFS